MGLRYVALGDSYTIGTLVTIAERWPDQLVACIPKLELVANLGVDGFTSQDVIEVELPRLATLRPEFLTVLIGVNDVVQGVLETTYRRNVALILDDLVRRVGAGRVLIVTTPDYTVTPSGAAFGDPAGQSAGIRRNNAIIADEAMARGIAVSTSTTCRCEPPLIAPWSRRMACIQAAPSTRCGSTESPRPSRTSLAAEGVAAIFASSAGFRYDWDRTRLPNR